MHRKAANYSMGAMALQELKQSLIAVYARYALIAFQNFVQRLLR